MIFGIIIIVIGVACFFYEAETGVGDGFAFMVGLVTIYFGGWAIALS